MTAVEFARWKGVRYETVLVWLKNGLIPGAIRHGTGKAVYWDIPATALEWKSPREAVEDARFAKITGRTQSIV
jgi:hypothetical protein